MTIRPVARMLFPLAAALAVPAVALAGTPPWSLEQNDPDPFCPAETVTAIPFAVAESAPILLQVLAANGIDPVATLVNGVLAAGLHTVIWDGADTGGVPVEDGSYVYRLTAGADPVLFQDEKTATVACSPSGTDPSSWGRTKARYR